MRKLIPRKKQSRLAKIIYYIRKKLRLVNFKQLSDKEEPETLYEIAKNNTELLSEEEKEKLFNKHNRISSKSAKGLVTYNKWNKKETVLDKILNV